MTAKSRRVSRDTEGRLGSIKHLGLLRDASGRRSSSVCRKSSISSCVLEPVPGRPTPAQANPNTQEAPGTTRSERVLVGLIVAHVNGGIAHQQTPRTLERHTLVRRAARNETDGILPAEQPRVVQALRRVVDRRQGPSPVPRLAIVHRHRIGLVFDDDARMRGKIAPETTNPVAAPAWDMRRSAPRVRARDSPTPATRGRCRPASGRRAARGPKSRRTDSGAPRRRADAGFAAACAPGRGPARSARACRRNRTPAARSNA